MITTDKDTLYRAMLARDPRYDGHFYVGVRTTGIYCRPVCPARPHLHNVDFYRSPAEAEGVGLRACLRCRPDLSPTSRQWQGTAAVVGRALTLINGGALDEGSVEVLATRLGISDRHLRRLFEEHLGASPVEVALSRRLHLAKHLLLQTPLPITEIALASGFQSLRRFNAAFKSRFRVSPSELRGKGGAEVQGLAQLHIPYIPPYDWGAQLHFFRRHMMAGVEDIGEDVFRRVFIWQGTPGVVTLHNNVARSRVEVQVDIPDVRALRVVIERVKNLLDLSMNPHLTLLEGDSELRQLMRTHAGLRVPGAWDPFETAVCIILGQLVSVDAARGAVARLIERFGEVLPQPPAPRLTHLFPTPAVLAAADLTTLGLPRVKAGAISALASAVHRGELDLSPAGDLATTRKQLLAIKGIGPWTVEMVAMRCLRDTDSFPQNDLIVRRALERHPENHQDWAPWRAYLTLMLWKVYA